MAKHRNQHFVPQFYFKSFTKGRRVIHVLLTAADRIILNTGVRGQCARHNFYGSPEIEKAFGAMEGGHSSSIRKAIASVWQPGAAPLELADEAKLGQAAIFQRSRTALEIDKHSPARESLLLEMFKTWVVNTKGEESARPIVEAIDAGQVGITFPPQSAILMSIDTAMENAALIADLGVYLLRNTSDYPFIFSDAPVVFYNQYLRNVRSRGVLGLQTPGLQLFWPLDERTALMMVDDDVYSGEFKRSQIVEVTGRADVSQLNALQLHHSLRAVYFANSNDEDYVWELWRTHRTTISKPQVCFRVRDSSWIVGEAPGGQLYHSYEEQLDFDLSLSFISCEPIAEADYQFRRRSPELFDEHRRRYPVPEW